MCTQPLFAHEALIAAVHAPANESALCQHVARTAASSTHTRVYKPKTKTRKPDDRRISGYHEQPHGKQIRAQNMVCSAERQQPQHRRSAENNNGTSKGSVATAVALWKICLRVHLCCNVARVHDNYTYKADQTLVSQPLSLIGRIRPQRLIQRHGTLHSRRRRSMSC